MEGTNKAHENGEAMGFVGVRLTAQLGRGHVLVVTAHAPPLTRVCLMLECFSSTLDIPLATIPEAPAKADEDPGCESKPFLQ